MIERNRILVPVDIDEAEHEATWIALRYPIAAAHAPGASLELMHVIRSEDITLAQVWWDSLSGYERSSKSLKTFIEDGREDGLEVLASAVRLEIPNEVRVRIMVGDIVSSIANFAAQCDRVVMTERPRGVLSRVFQSPPIPQQVAKRISTPLVVLPVPVAGERPPMSLPVHGPPSQRDSRAS